MGDYRRGEVSIDGSDDSQHGGNVIRIRARNRHGVIRTDFGARWMTAPLERHMNWIAEEMLRDWLLWGIPAPGPFEQPHGFWGLGLANLIGEQGLPPSR